MLISSWHLINSQKLFVVIIPSGDNSTDYCHIGIKRKTGRRSKASGIPFRCSALLGFRKEAPECRAGDGAGAQGVPRQPAPHPTICYWSKQGI